MAFRKRKHCGPCALEVTNLNAVAINLPRICSKSQPLPNSVIFITHDGLFWPILLLVDLAMSIIRKREQTET